MDTRTDELIKILISKTSKFSEVDLADFRIRVKDPAVQNLSQFPIIAKCLDDLKMQLINAAPGSQFVTSDNPVFQYNLYCEESNEGGKIGALKVGLLLFIPLSPQLCLLLYDGSVYKVGQPNISRPVISTDDEL